ncbi:MAG: HAD family phosphatase [Syntrophobacteria bacterium]
MTKNQLRLALFDIDGTLRRVRDPWIHLHHHLGVAEQTKDLPARWQRGEITYEQWAQLDASFWRGSTRETIAAALRTNPFRDGARELINWFTLRAIPCVGISSGLSIFNEITAAELGIKEVISNELQFDGDICNGEISIQVNEENKGEIMDEILKRYSVGDEQVAAFGDGRADIPLLRKAGLGIAICPSNDKVRSSARHVVGDEPIDRAIMLVEKHFGMG